MSEEIIETAKAAQEIAKTTGKAIDMSEKVGGFIAKHVEGSLEAAIGIFEDKLKFFRWERQVRLMEQVDAILKSRGKLDHIKLIPLKLAIPLFEAASLEEDDSLQDLWINLLVNASDETSGISLQRYYIDLLERLTPVEAKIINQIYSHTCPYEGYVTITSFLPTTVVWSSKYASKKNFTEPDLEIKLALLNLERLGCLSLNRIKDEQVDFKTVSRTLLGENFIKACS